MPFSSIWCLELIVPGFERRKCSLYGVKRKGQLGQKKEEMEGEERQKKKKEKQEKSLGREVWRNDVKGNGEIVLVIRPDPFRQRPIHPQSIPQDSSVLSVNSTAELLPSFFPKPLQAPPPGLSQISIPRRSPSFRGLRDRLALWSCA